MEIDVHTYLMWAVINSMTAAIIGIEALRAPGGEIQSIESIATANEENNRKELEASFLKALEGHRGIMIKICRTYCNNRADQEDLFQEIVYQLWKAYRSFLGTGQVSTWMHSIAMKTAIIPFRGRSAKVKIELREQLPDQPAEDETPEGGSSDRFLKLFLRLPNYNRAVLVLLCDGYTQNEIALLLELNEATVRKRMSRIRKKIDEL